MHKALLPSPSLEDLIHSAKNITQEFKPHKFVYLDSKGRWKENPGSLIERISNEFLFKIWQLDENSRSAFILKIFLPFSEAKNWMMVKKMKLALSGKSKPAQKPLEKNKIDTLIGQSYSSGRYPGKDYPFLIILEVLLWLLRYEAIRINSESNPPSWDTLAKAQNQEDKERISELNQSLEKHLSKQEKESLLFSLLTRIKESSPEIIASTIKIKAEEDRLMRTIQHLLIKARDIRSRYEFYSLICEKIQPPMGVVTYTSPSLLLPCLYLLKDDSIDISSGLPYNASVILSILQDPRSTETLLKALCRIPFHYTKIRENIIYTLGNLREKKAAKAIAAVLDKPDHIVLSEGNQKRKKHPILEQKEEAIWALGKIGLESLPHLSKLVKYGDHPWSKIKTYLAWTLGEIGAIQKRKLGGVSADIVITLLRLLKTSNKQVFEEAVSALRKIALPEFTHSLYLYNIGAISILGLQPAQKGLYELSETLHHLLGSKKRAIIAVNGDSGTGKTYFCESIIGGFGEVKPEDILYLMRDRKKDQKVFNRILGLRWLKKHIDPIHYQDYPLSEEEDDPEGFFRKFLEETTDKKLVILDGCRDEYYFQRVIDLFYFKGKLDIEVNFRATYSTKRLNLENREMAMESVKTHLSFTEEPSLEDTHFYQEGIVILYDLDNSITSRLNSQEIQELFEKRKIDRWGDLIRVGGFREEPKPLKMETQKISLEEDSFCLKNENWPKLDIKAFSAEERKFKAELNENPTEKPHLLQTIDVDDLKAQKIKFYAQDQVAGIGEEGSVFVLSFLDDRIFYTFAEKSNAIALLGRDLFLTDDSGGLRNISFERNEIMNWGKTLPPVTAITAFPRNKIVSGHIDGTIRIWDFLNKYLFALEGHRQPILSLAIDYSGRIFSGSLDRTLRRWDMEKGKVTIIENLKEPIHSLKLYPQQRILALSEATDADGLPKANGASKISLFDFKDRFAQMIQAPYRKKISSVNVYFDGRIMATLSTLSQETEKREGNLIIISPDKSPCIYQSLEGHTKETKDVLVMGPKIITCGSETSQSHTLRLWGTEFYVRMELSKLSLQNP